MKAFFILLLSTFYFIKANSQTPKLNLSDSCSNILNNVSYFWIKDSLANNGFRLYAYDRLLKCKVDKLTVSYLFDKLGKPNEVKRSNKGTDYMYYYYDTKAMPKEFGPPSTCGYIYFMFEGNGTCLTSIGQGILDY